MRAPSADARPGTHRFLFAALGLHGFLKLARLVGLFLGTAPLLRLYSGSPRCQHNIGVKLFRDGHAQKEAHLAQVFFQRLLIGSLLLSQHVGALGVRGATPRYRALR